MRKKRKIIRKLGDFCNNCFLNFLEVLAWVIWFNRQPCIQLPHNRLCLVNN